MATMQDKFGSKAGAHKVHVVFLYKIEDDGLDNDKAAKTIDQIVPNRNIASLQVPEGAVGFYFYDQINYRVGGQERQGASSNYSAHHRIAKSILDLNEVKTRFPNDTAVHRKMIAESVNATVDAEGKPVALRKDTIVVTPDKRVIRNKPVIKVEPEPTRPSGPKAKGNGNGRR